MDIKEAVSSPRFHSQWLPDVIMTEPRGLSRDVIQNLELKGHTLVPYKGGYIGEANGILITEDGFYGGGDSRGETSAVGYLFPNILSTKFKYMEGPTNNAFSSIVK